MGQTTNRKTSIAGLALELDANVPSDVHLLPPGPFRSLDGRPAECAAWQLNDLIAAVVIARAGTRKNDILIDFEHQSLRSRDNGQRAEAAGWIPRTLEWRGEGDHPGLYATNVSWVGDTAQLIKDKKYRYISAVFLYDTVTGEVLEIVSVALTNTPALDGLEALADLARVHSVFSTEEEADMADKEQVAALTVERDGLQTKVTALTAERDGLNTKVATLTAERDALQAEKDEAGAKEEKEKHAALLTAALTDGRLVPALKPWAEKQSLAQLTEFLGAAKPLPIAQDKQHKEEGKAENHGLNDEELAMCSRMDITPEAFAKTKAAQSA